jgi:hypothetical protein
MKRKKTKPPFIFWVHLLAIIALSVAAIRETLHAQTMQSLANECVAQAQECSNYLEACVGLVQQGEKKGDGYLR